MKTYKITFKHTVELTYEAEIEANSKKEATEIFDKDPFQYIINQDSNNGVIDENGLEIEIEDIEVVE